MERQRSTPQLAQPVGGGSEQLSAPPLTLDSVAFDIIRGQLLIP
jgi:hypothetical protein